MEREPAVSTAHLFDYLFLVWKSGIYNFIIYFVNKNYPTLIMAGQVCVDLCKDGLPNEGFISLSNSVNLADAPRLGHLSPQDGPLSAMELAKISSGKLLLCKVFIGQSAQVEQELV